jgi:hypothetical protein
MTGPTHLQIAYGSCSLNFIIGVCAVNRHLRNSRSWLVKIIIGGAHGEPGLRDITGLVRESSSLSGQFLTAFCGSL